MTVGLLTVGMMCITPSLGNPVNDAQNRRSKRHGMDFVWVSQGYFVGSFEVTQEDWERLMGKPFRQAPKEDTDEVEGPVPFYRGPDVPIYGISAKMASDFVSALNKLEEKIDRESRWHFFIPSEHQWEVAARAGAKTKFVTGKWLRPGEAVFNYNRRPKLRSPELNDWLRRENSLPPVTRPSPVGKGSLPNRVGLYDVHGNVAEITITPYDQRELYPVSYNQDLVVTKGGSWSSPMALCAFSERGFAFTGSPGMPGAGLRLFARSIEQQP